MTKDRIPALAMKKVLLLLPTNDGLSPRFKQMVHMTIATLIRNHHDTTIESENEKVFLLFRINNERPGLNKCFIKL